MGLSWKEYGLKCDGYLRKEERSERTEWERLRWQTLHLINYAQGVKRPIKDPKRLIRFPWEKGEVVYTHKDWLEAKQKLGEYWIN